MSFADDAWFAGFIDGEGCFTRFTTHGKYRPSFSIGLRWDDEPILRALWEEFGGSIHSAHSREVGNRQQGVKWTVKSRADLQRLVAYLDRFPLRAKKAAQFADWRAEYEF